MIKNLNKEEIFYICSPRTYTLLQNNFAVKLTADYHCPNYTKLRGKGQKKLYALIYKVIVGQVVETLLVEGIYDWRKEK